MIRARAPMRLDLGGGTLDLWPLYLLHEGAVTVNVAVDLYAEAVLEPLGGGRVRIVSEDLGEEEEAGSVEDLRRDGPLSLVVEVLRNLDAAGLEVRTSSQAPPGSGLGGSSALAIALIAAVDRHQGRERPQEEACFLARQIETRVLGFPAGSQDYYSAAYGGCLALHWEPEGCLVERLPVGLRELDDRLAVAYTGVPHHSGLNNWVVLRDRIEGNEQVREHLDGIRDTARTLASALREGDWEGVAAAVNREWSHRRLLGSHISTPAIDALAAEAGGRGCLASKVCGAGGGGCVLFLCEEGRREDVERLFPDHGGRALRVHPVEEGVLVEGE